MSSQNLSQSQFKQYTLHFNPAQYDEDDYEIPDHEIVAKLNGEQVGHLQWDAYTNEVTGVGVHPEHRRQGLATAMFDMANKITKNNMSHSSIRTSEGDAWVKSVGGHTPERYEG